jgi:hypothetical protein
MEERNIDICNAPERGRYRVFGLCGHNCVTISWQNFLTEAINDAKNALKTLGYPGGIYIVDHNGNEITGW